MTGRHGTAVVADKGYFAMSAICDAQQTGIAVCVPQPAAARAAPGATLSPTSSMILTATPIAVPKAKS